MVAWLPGGTGQKGWWLAGCAQAVQAAQPHAPCPCAVALLPPISPHLRSLTLAPRLPPSQAKRLEELDALYRDEAIMRKKIFNQMEDMKGKIRVYCRVRPILQMEKDRGQTGGSRRCRRRRGLAWLAACPLCCAACLPAAVPSRPCSPVVCVRPSLASPLQLSPHSSLPSPPAPAEAVMIPDELTIGLNWKGTKKEWSFDSVFGATTHQDKVFEDTKHLIQSAVDGYNVCIFACEWRLGP